MRLTMREMFKKMGYDFDTMEVGKPYTPVGKWMVASWNENTCDAEKKRITRIVRKENTRECVIDCGMKKVSVSEGHRCYVKLGSDQPRWEVVSELLGRDFHAFVENDGWTAATAYMGVSDIEIADIEVDGTHAYFSNGILSHNTLYGDPMVPPGGKAIPFHASVRIRLGAGKQIENKQGEAIGIHVNAKTMKNKLSPPFRSCEFRIHFGVGIKEHEELFDLLRPHGKTRIIVDSKEYDVEVEGTGGWKLFTVHDSSGKELHKKNFHKPEFNELLDDPVYAPFLDALIEHHMVRKMNDPSSIDIDSESLADVQAVADAINDNSEVYDEAMN